MLRVIPRQELGLPQLGQGWRLCSGCCASLGLDVRVVNEWGWRSLASVSCDCVKSNVHCEALSEDAVKRCDVSWRLERNVGCGSCTNK